MKVTELRSGNIVDKMYVGIGGQANYWSPNAFNIDDFRGIEKYPQFYKPIPLTEEWLLINTDFENIYDVVSYLEDESLFSLSGSNEKLIEYLEDIHVHTFQNLIFALTSKDIKPNY